MNIIRTIHPVGQGAFYSEEFTCDNGNTVLMVYDCGSTTDDGKHLISEISSFFSTRKTIDILFISHFDDDHVNGIEEIRKCGVKIKTIVSPLVDQNDEWFYICTNNSVTQAMINSPARYFGADNSIRIEPFYENQERESLEPFIIRNNDNETNIVRPSGTHISLQAIEKYWVYIIFNYDEAKRRKKLINGLKKEAFFKDTAKNKKCKVEDLLHDADFIVNYRSEINKVYKNICTDGSNKCSLIVYSGVAGNKISESWFICVHFNKLNLKSLQLNSEGGLYLGDTDLKQGRSKKGKIITHIKKLLKPCSDRIVIIQLPHHGSDKNFTNALLKINRRKKLFFASYGALNNYKHPSECVIKQVKQGNQYYYDVDEHSHGIKEIISVR